MGLLIELGGFSVKKFYVKFAFGKFKLAFFTQNPPNSVFTNKKILLIVMNSTKKAPEQ